MGTPPFAAQLFGQRVKSNDFKDILFDYQHYNRFDARLFDEQGRLNKQMTILPIDEHLYDQSILFNLHSFDKTIDKINQQRAILFPLFSAISPLTNERLTFQLNVLLVPLLNISNHIIEYYHQQHSPSLIERRRGLAAELHSIVKFLQATHSDMYRYRELSLLELNFMEEIEVSRGYIKLHDTIVSQPRMELEEEQQDFHDIYLHDRLLSYRNKALNRGLDKLRAERDKQKESIDKALSQFERQYQAEIRNRTKIIDTLNSYLGDTFLNELYPEQGYEVLPSSRRRNTEFSRYLNALLPLYTGLRKLAIENDIFDSLQKYAKRHYLINQHQ